MAESGSSAEESDGEGDNEDNQQVGIETHSLLKNPFEISRKNNSSKSIV